MRLINDLLDLTKIEAGKMELQCHPVDAKIIFKEINAIFSHRVKEKGLDFHISIDPNLPDWLMLDEVRLRQILFNLVGNAVKFTEEGYVKLSVYNECQEEKKGYIDLIFTVRDTGISIPKDQINLIFEPFKQQDGLSSKYGGTGLGLAITKRLVEMMDGEIMVMSEKGKGSVFNVVIRNVPIVQMFEADESSDNVDYDKIKFNKFKVLIADDNAINRELLMEYLDFPGVEFFMAENGKEAVSLCKKNRPDIILIDIKMPVMSGYDAIQIIKGDENLKSIPIIAITAYAMNESLERIKDCGCDSILKKPLSRKELFIELSRYLPYDILEPDETEKVVKQVNISTVDIEAIEPDVLKKLPGIMENLEHELMENWNRIQKVFVINEIIGFGEKIHELSVQYSLGKLNIWSEDLIDQAKSFDMEKLPVTLSKFPEIIKDLNSFLDKKNLH